MKDMDVASFDNLLRKSRACPPGKDWAVGKTLAEVWHTCDRGDWLLWLVGKMADTEGWPTRQEVVLAACDCVEPALKHLPEGEDRALKAIEVTRRWARGEATIDEVEEAADAADAAARDGYLDTSSALYRASEAAFAAAHAAFCRATSAAHAAFFAASVVDKSDEEEMNLRLSADICRNYFTVDRS